MMPSLHRLRGAAAAVLLTAAGAAQALSFAPLPNSPHSPVIQQIVPVTDQLLVAVASGGQMYRNDGNGGGWTRFGESLGLQVVTLAYGGGTYYASTRTSATIAQSGIFASSDDGATWRAFSSGIPTEFGTYNIGIGSLVADANYVYVGANASSNAGLYRSAHGATAAWTSIHGLGSGRDAVLVKNGDALCLWSPQDYRFGVEYSLDNGNTWAKGSGVGYPASGDFSNNPAPSAVGGTALSADGTRLYTNNSNNARLYRSDDGCKTFTSTQPAAFSNAERPQNIGVTLAGVLYAAGSSGKIYSSSDAGATFADAGGADYSAAEGRSIVQFARNGEGILFGTNGDGLYTLTRGGFTRDSAGFAVSQVSALATASDHSLLALLDGSGLHVIADGQPERSAGNSGLPRSGKTLLADGDALYVNTGSSLLRSLDGGARWTTATSGLSGIPSYSIVGPIAAGGDLYVGIAGQVFRSSDGAASWTAVAGTLPVNSTITSMAYAAGALLVRASNFALSAQGVYRSTDGGATFTLSNSGLPAQSSDLYPQFNRFYNQASGVYLQAPNTRLYRSTDGGASWAAFSSDNLPTSSFMITAFTEDARGTLYLSYAGPAGADLYYKPAAASAWTRDRSGLPASTRGSSWGAAMQADATGLTLAVRDEGLYRSELAAATPPPAAPDTVPDAFVFADQNDVAVNSVVTSNEVTVSGIDAATSVQIGDIGEYSINGGAYTAAPGTVVNGDRLRLRHTASANAGSAVVSVLTVGGIEGRFTSRTAAATAVDTTPDAYDFGDVIDAEPDTDTSSLPQVINGINAATGISCSACRYSVNGAAFTSGNGVVNDGDVVTLRLRSSGDYASTVSATVTIGGVSDTFSVRTRAAPVTPPPAPDTTPDAFTFATQTGVEPGSVVTSAPVTIGGIDAAAAVSVSGGEYSINGGDFGSAAGTVVAGDALRLRHTASASPARDTRTQLSVGGVVGTFVSRTADAAPADDATPDAFTFTDVVGVAAGTQVTSNTVTISGINVATAISVKNGEYRIGDGDFTRAAGLLMNGDTVSLRAVAPAAGSSALTTLLIGDVQGSLRISSAADTPPPATGSSALISDINGRPVQLRSDAGHLSNVRLLTPPPGAPQGVAFATGLFAFDIEDLEPGATVHVTLTLPSNTGMDAYYKYGPEAGQPTPHYYRFDFDGSTGAQLGANAVTLTLVDNGRGDSDARAGRISDPGAPAQITPVVVVDAHSGGGSLGSGLLLVLLTLALLRRCNAAALRGLLAGMLLLGIADAGASDLRWSLSLRGGAASSQLSADTLQRKLAERGHSVNARVERDAAAGALLAGYEFHPGFVIELGAAYLGRYDVAVVGPSNAPTKLVRDLGELAPSAGWATSLMLRTPAPLWSGSALSFEPRAGVFYRWNEVEGRIAGDTFTRRQREAGVQLGLGLSYALNPRLSLGLGGDLYLAGNDDAIAIYGAQIETRF